jgi:hypothetical protein
MATQIYSEIVKQVLNQYAKLQPSHGQIRLDTLFDDAQGRYALMQVGWDRGARVRGNLLYVLVQEERVVIEYDGMERGIVDDLIAHGISPDRIELAFLPAESAILIPA